MSLTLKTPALLMVLITLVALAFVSSNRRRTVRAARVRSHVGPRPAHAESIFRSPRPKAERRSREDMNDELREIVHDGQRR